MAFLKFGCLINPQFGWILSLPSIPVSIFSLFNLSYNKPYVMRTISLTLTRTHTWEGQSRRTLTVSDRVSVENPCQSVNSRGFQDKLSWRQDTRQLITFGYSSFGMSVLCRNVVFTKNAKLKEANKHKNKDCGSLCCFRPNSRFHGNWLLGIGVYCETTLEAYTQPAN